MTVENKITQKPREYFVIIQRKTQELYHEKDQATLYKNKEAARRDEDILGNDYMIKEIKVTFLNSRSGKKKLKKEKKKQYRKR